MFGKFLIAWLISVSALASTLEGTRPTEETSRLVREFLKRPAATENEITEFLTGNRLTLRKSFYSFACSQNQANWCGLAFLYEKNKVKKAAYAFKHCELTNSEEYCVLAAQSQLSIGARKKAKELFVKACEAPGIFCRFATSETDRSARPIRSLAEELCREGRTAFCNLPQ